MQRYYFNIEGNGIEIIDKEGVVLPPSPDILEALQALIAEVAGEENWLDIFAVRCRMHVIDDTGTTIVVVPLDRSTGASQRERKGMRQAEFAN